MKNNFFHIKFINRVNYLIKGILILKFEFETNKKSQLTCLVFYLVIMAYFDFFFTFLKLCSKIIFIYSKQFYCIIFIIIIIIIILYTLKRKNFIHF